MHTAYFILRISRSPLELGTCNPCACRAPCTVHLEHVMSSNRITFIRYIFNEIHSHLRFNKTKNNIKSNDLNWVFVVVVHFMPILPIKIIPILSCSLFECVAIFVHSLFHFILLVCRFYESHFPFHNSQWILILLCCAQVNQILCLMFVARSIVPQCTMYILNLHENRGFVPNIHYIYNLCFIRNLEKQPNTNRTADDRSARRLMWKTKVTPLDIVDCELWIHYHLESVVI